ncbi:hypothetical protein BAUCODRAFT_63809 [Baudoinia panamericana UAMH 10762]|uniref:Ribonuclease T2-like n=1 Tax=Baudoinia panamericana (strain UAMH 10762) TaxID=717646 RepID=M2NLW0_BAUPA|nr:uncharacterized protein BAUCODRAFT_63809 [Baudoinia panamericana UAMH 10762]EMD00151.1 hypothetical protein BAUCODRAFT_63809 [Baudoinia panamericana UAMH 10762]
MNAIGSSAVCVDAQLSCHNTSAVENLCCFNYPGGTLLQTQFWDTHPVTGPVDSWTIHGLWPDNCDGTYDANCDDERAYRNITQILKHSGAYDLLNDMQTLWVSDSGSSETFWEHEWGKHGTCISTLQPSCYTDYQPTQEVTDFFNRTVTLFKSLPSYEWLESAGIVPSITATYTRQQIQSALGANRGDRSVYLGCRHGALNEIWYFFNVQGSIQTGSFKPSDLVGTGSTCPSSGIKYLPKGAAGPSPTSTTTTTGPSPTSTGPVLSGRGFLDVITSGNKRGCIISRGRWYTSGSCAGFTASPLSGGFTLKSSKGYCGVADGALTCGARIRNAPLFNATKDGTLLYNGAQTFYADGVPRGRKQGMVYTDAEHDTSLTIRWQKR